MRDTSGLKEVVDLLRQLLEATKRGSMPEILSLEQAGEQIADRHPNTIKRMVRRGELRAVPLGNTIGIPREEVERLARGEPSPVRGRRERAARKPEPARTTAETIRALAKKF
jgi:excisionase family DNA binding protein